MGPALSRGAVYRHMLGSIQTHSSMAKVKSPRAKPQAGRARIVKSSRNAAVKKQASPHDSKARWVRKSMVVDQRKLDVAKRAFGATTEKEAIDKALDMAAFYQELSDGLDAVSRAGGIDDIWKRR
jgi:hypothetical protein